MTTTRDDLGPADADLIARLERTLQAKAAEARRPAEPFDPTRGTTSDGDLHPADRGARRRRLRFAAVAAVAASVLVVAAAVGLVARSDDDPSSDGDTRIGSGPADETPPPTDGEGTAPAAPPDGILVPGWVPDGLTLWSVEWRRTSGGPGIPTLNLQLFEAPGGGRVLIDIDGEATLGGGVQPGDPVTVRGVAGSVQPAKEFPETSSTILWEEGISLSATFAGMSLDEALTLLADLSWRSDDRLEGFDAPDDGGVTLLAEAPPDATGAAGLSAQFVYRDDLTSVELGEGRQLEVRTTTPGRGPGRDLLLTMLHADADADEGDADADAEDDADAKADTERDDGRVESYDPAYGTLSVVWPDGRDYWIDANGTSLTQDELRRVADGIAAASGTEVAALQDDVSARVVDELDLIGEAELPSGTVRIRGWERSEGEVWRLACFVPTGGDEMCASPATSGVWEANGPVTDGFVVDGERVVAGAGPAGTTYTFATDDAGRQDDQTPLEPDEAVTIGDLTYVILRPPPEAEMITATDPATGVGFGVDLTPR